MKKPISIFLAICFALTLPISAFAAPRRYAYIDRMSAGLSIDGGGRASSGGTVQAAYADTTVSVEVSLQQYKDGVWTTLESWSGSGPGYMFLSVSGDLYVTSGYWYRAVSAAAVYDGDGNVLERASKATTEKWY